MSYNNRKTEMACLQQRSYIQKSTNVMDKDKRKNAANEIYFTRTVKPDFCKSNKTITKFNVSNLGKK
jgi:hypothetical protein